MLFVFGVVGGTSIIFPAVATCKRQKIGKPPCVLSACDGVRG